MWQHAANRIISAVKTRTMSWSFYPSDEVNFIKITPDKGQLRISIWLDGAESAWLYFNRAQAERLIKAIRHGIESL